MKIWTKLFGHCADEQQAREGLNDSATAAEIGKAADAASHEFKEGLSDEDPPDVQIETLAARLARVAVSGKARGDSSSFDAQRQVTKLQGRLRDAVNWLRGGTDALGGRPTPSGVGYVLCQVIPQSTIGDHQWVASMKAAIGGRTWDELTDVFNKIKVVGEKLQKQPPKPEQQATAVPPAKDAAASSAATSPEGKHAGSVATVAAQTSAAAECDRIADEIGRIAISARPSLFVATGFRHDVELKALQDQLHHAATTLRDGYDTDRRPVAPSTVAASLGDMILATLGNERWVMPMISALGNSGWRHLRQVVSEINDVRKHLESAIPDKTIQASCGVK